jgi:hypothetical protein
VTVCTSADVLSVYLCSGDQNDCLKCRIYCVHVYSGEQCDCL